MEAIYSGAMPMDLIASEQQRISSQLAGIEARLDGTRAKFDEVEANLARALDLARDCHAAYLTAEPGLRRLFNQAFFTHLYIDDDGVRHDYSEPFDVILSEGVLEAGRAIQADREAGLGAMAHFLGQPMAGPDDKTPRTLRVAGGLVAGALAPVRGAVGSNKAGLVREVDYRWNQLEPSLRLMYKKLASIPNFVMLVAQQGTI